ncbi:MAG: SspB family protein [Pikeienuella sp.]
MADRDGLDYGRLMQKALRGLMAEVLGHVAEYGLSGTHHFYIGIDTTHPGVDMPEYLKDRYPREMTIVLQEWYADLAVLGDRFQVTLNFANRPETLVVPFAAVQTFIDPSVKFGLKFDEDEGGDGGFMSAQERDGRQAPPAAAPAEPGSRTEPSDHDNGDDDPDGGGQPSADVVSLDKFRRS